MHDLVMTRVDAGEEYVLKPMGRALAEASGVEVVDEPARRPDGSVKPERRVRKRSGRPAKKKTTVAKEAAAKKAAVIDSESAPTEKEN